MIYIHPPLKILVYYDILSALFNGRFVCNSLPKWLAEFGRAVANRSVTRIFLRYLQDFKKLLNYVYRPIFFPQVNFFLSKISIATQLSCHFNVYRNCWFLEHWVWWFMTLCYIRLQINNIHDNHKKNMN